MSVNSPLGTLTASFAIAAAAVAQSQIFATIVDDPRKTGVTDYQLASNIAAQIVDAYTIGAPSTDGQIFIQKNGGAEQRNLGLLSNLRNDITNNRRPTPTIAPLNLAPGDKITCYIVTSVASATVTGGVTDTLYLTVVTAPVQRNVTPAPRSGGFNILTNR
jgi:hypothetical protein